MESRLVEDTFTSEEVKDMLTGSGAWRVWLPLSSLLHRTGSCSEGRCGVRTDPH